MLGSPPDCLRVISMLGSPPDCLRVLMVRTVGLEPTLPYGKGILSPQRLPFRHVRSGAGLISRC